MNIKQLILILCAGSMAGWAANDAAVQGPVTGYIFDAQTHAIRPMLGIPGAAYLGAPVASRVDAAAVSPDGSAALVVQAAQVTLYSGLANLQPAAVPMPGALAADNFAWGPSGTAAAVYSSATRQAQVLSNLPAAPSAGLPMDLSGLAGKVTAMAFDGQRIILAVASATAGGIYSVTAQSGPQLVASAGSPFAIVLAGADLYYADNQAQQIWQVRSYATRPAPVLFAADAGISSPAALQLSSDGARLYVANAGSRTLGVYDVAARSPVQSLPLNFSPTKLDRFGDASVFLLNSVSQGKTPLYVLSDKLDKRAVYFVPGSGGVSPPRPYHYKPQ